MAASSAGSAVQAVQAVQAVRRCAVLTPRSGPGGDPAVLER